MAFFKKNHTYQKSVSCTVGISAISVIVALFAVSLLEFYALRAIIFKDLNELAVITGERNKAAITFGAKEQAKDNLSILVACNSVVQACIYDEFGAEFVHYTSDNHKNASCRPALTERAVIKKDTMEMVKNITGDSGIVGSIYLESTTEQLDRYIKRQAISALSVALVTTMLSCLLAVRLRRVTLPTSTLGK